MWTALGSTLLHLHRRDDAIRAYERAIKEDDTEGVATQRLATLYKQMGDEEKAARCYMRHLELRYQVTNPAASAEEAVPKNIDTLLQGLALESQEAEACLFLASYHQKHAEYDTAMVFCSRLLDYPGPEKDMAKGMLRELKTRKRGPGYNTRSQAAAASSNDGFVFSP